MNGSSLYERRLYEFWKGTKKLDLLGIEPRTFPTLDVSKEDKMLRENYTTKPQAR